jgi:Eukaryotic aspartyl protease
MRAKGNIITDNAKIGDLEIEALEMGLTWSQLESFDVGILGVGYNTNEATDSAYPGVLDQMVAQDLINSRAYGLWLNDGGKRLWSFLRHGKHWLTETVDAISGSIQFGGIDIEKFSGMLKTVDFVPDADTGKITSPTIQLTSLAITKNGDSNSLTDSQQKMSVVLDPHTDSTYLPISVMDSVADALGGRKKGQWADDYMVVSCSAITPNMTLDFGFGGSDGPLIQVLLYRNIVNVDYEADVCSLRFANNGAEPGYNYILGNSFLRSVYAVFDLDNDQVSLAQARLNLTSSSVVEIPKGPDGVASALFYWSSSSVATTSTSTSDSTLPSSSASGSTTSLTSTTAATFSSTSTQSTGTAVPSSAASELLTPPYVGMINLLMAVISVCLGSSVSLVWWKI